jgi:hypothetical protein
LVLNHLKIIEQSIKQRCDFTKSYTPLQFEVTGVADTQPQEFGNSSFACPLE